MQIYYVKKPDLGFFIFSAFPFPLKVDRNDKVLNN